MHLRKWCDGNYAGPRLSRVWYGGLARKGAGGDRLRPEGLNRQVVLRSHWWTQVLWSFPWPLGQGTIQHAYRGPHSNFFPS